MPFGPPRPKRHSTAVVQPFHTKSANKELLECHADHRFVARYVRHWIQTQMKAATVNYQQALKVKVQRLAHGGRLVQYGAESKQQPRDEIIEQDFAADDQRLEITSHVYDPIFAHGNQLKQDKRNWTPVRTVTSKSTNSSRKQEKPG